MFRTKSSIVKLDFDEPFESFGVEALRDKIDFVEMVTHLKPERIDIMQSRHGNTHVKIYFHQCLPDFAVLALQAILGSDWRRETYNFRRIMRGQRNWNILFAREL